MCAKKLILSADSTEYIKPGSALPPFLPYPKFLLRTDLSLAARQLYAVMLGRATLSQVNKWVDEFGAVYIIFTINDLADTIDRSPMTVKTALRDLEDSGLIERRHTGRNRPNHIFVRMPTESSLSAARHKSIPGTDALLYRVQNENFPLIK